MPVPIQSGIHTAAMICDIRKVSLKDSKGIMMPKLKQAIDNKLNVLANLSWSCWQLNSSLVN
jgi:hypothetical protein